MAEAPAEWIRARLEEWRARERVDDRGKVDRWAKYVGVGPSTVSQWLRSAARPNEYNCILLAEATGFPLEEVRIAMGRSMRVSRPPAPYKVDDSLFTEFQGALGRVEYQFLSSLDPKERRELLLAWATIIRPHIGLLREIRELRDARAT